MPALNHRGLALKLAVENYAFGPVNDDEEVENISLVDADGVVDETVLGGVLQLADRFVTWLGTDEADTPVATEAPATEAPDPTPAPLSTRDQLLQLAESKRTEYGSVATDNLLGAIRMQVNGGVSLSTAADYAANGSLDSTVGRIAARDFAQSIRAL